MNDVAGDEVDVVDLSDISSDDMQDEATKSSSALYMGDTGELPNDARRILVHLLANGHVDHRRHPNLWNTLIRHREKIQSRLCDLYLELIIDLEARVAFQRQADTGELEAPRLLRDHQLRLYDSLLMLYLRQVLSHADAQGLLPTVSMEEILDHMVVYDASVNRNSADFRARVTAALTRVHKKVGVLHKVPGVNEQYEISRVLKLMLGVDEVNALRELYKNLKDADPSAHAAEPQDTE
jgi:uncharacterized coiled-coil protein SlyX